ncbi:hypothetical protein BGZ63DRAFT_418883 [Mariannaea sp. PMI_226]|nr:hypothetical protein BGZ63DRAFT_418883 [Mariannaea sp. PMI_226]
MDEIYQKIADFNPVRFNNNTNLLTFDVTEIWRNQSTGAIRCEDRVVEVPHVASWLAEETVADESLVLRLVWTVLDFGTKTVGLPKTALSAILTEFGLKLAFEYSLTRVSGVNEFPPTKDAGSDSVRQAHAFTYAPKLASVWSHTHFRNTKSLRTSATYGIVLAAEKQKVVLKALLRSKWQPTISTHPMFPAFLFTFMLSTEIEETVAGMKPRIQEVETRTGHQSFESKRKGAASGLLGELSAEMSGSASKLASAERKSKTIEKLTDFILKHSGEEAIVSTASPQTAGINLDGDSLMRSHVNVLRERLSMQSLDNAYTLKRVQLQIEALVNLIGQHDSINNTDIALSSHRDASSMKTLAVVTMFFLPGSFIAALFSTPCFNWASVDVNNFSSIGVASTPQFSLYWAITIPMTLLTFVLYYAWLLFQTYQRRKLHQSPGSAHPGSKRQADAEEQVEAKLVAAQKSKFSFPHGSQLSSAYASSTASAVRNSECAQVYTTAHCQPVMAARVANPPAPMAASTGGVVPAQLGFLTIFNPSLGKTDETIDDQIVYYASASAQSSAQKRRRTRGRPTRDIPPEERNERLRQIGLAQGMASFSRGFAGGASVDAIDTEKSRVVLHELEPGWWVLASIDLTRVPLPPRLPIKSTEPGEERYEYSSREMKPANMLMRDLLRAHNIFLMHHNSSLSSLFDRTKRIKFVALLSRYWDLFLSTWSVMLHGNPAKGIFGGINIAASGELGVGVGEEDRGSGERAVLEGLVGRIEGLVDLVVSKFGDYDPEAQPESTPHGEPLPWLGTGQEPGAEDGAIFLGSGALSRRSLRDVTQWIEDLYTWGEHAYGVIDKPTSSRRTKKTQPTSKKPKKDDHPPAITPQQTEAPRDVAQQVTPDSTTQGKAQNLEAEDGRLDKMVSYLKLGYGTYWSLPGSSGESAKNSPADEAAAISKPDSGITAKRDRLHSKRTSSSEAEGHYLIGLRGDIEEEAGGKSDGDASQSLEDSDQEHNSRTVLRTVHVELENESVYRPESTVHEFEQSTNSHSQSQGVDNTLPGHESQGLDKSRKLGVVVYVNRPFIFVFLFEPHTESLAWDTLYRSLHYQLAPLRKPLLISTRYRPERAGASTTGSDTNSIYDLIWDPVALTVHSSIPNIPDSYMTTESWSRADALNTHFHLLNIHAASCAHNSVLEHTQKTNRGWWIVWTRILDRQDETASTSNTNTTNLSTIHEDRSDAGSDSVSQVSDSPSSLETGRRHQHAPTVSKEFFLIRRASDHVGFRTDSSTGGGDGARRLAQGIGVDTRRYVEELLSLL